MGSVERVQEFFTTRGIGIEVVQLEKSARTAPLAAAAIGTELGSIVKSLIFLANEEIILVLVAGDKRAHVGKIGRALGSEGVRIASADEVREKTGYVIGGVPPVGHEPQLRTIIDQTMQRFTTVYAAAGSPHAIFPIGFDQLVELTRGELVDIVEE